MVLVEVLRDIFSLNHARNHRFPTRWYASGRYFYLARVIIGPGFGEQ